MSVEALADWRTPRHRPVRITRLLELFERNFLQLQRLIPELDLPFNEAVSSSPRDLPLRLTVTERGAYTVAFRLTYDFARAPNGERQQPNLHVRVYRDVGLVEALTEPRRPDWCEDEQGVGRYLDQQWERNLLLHKWLHYLLENGHGFSVAGRPREKKLSTAPDGQVG